MAPVAGHRRSPGAAGSVLQIAATATAVFTTRISVQWTASTDDLSQVWYTLIVDGSPLNENQLGFLSANLFHLEPQSTHTFRVDPRDA